MDNQDMNNQNMNNQNNKLLTEKDFKKFAKENPPKNKMDMKEFKKLMNLYNNEKEGFENFDNIFDKEVAISKIIKNYSNFNL